MCLCLKHQGLIGSAVEGPERLREMKPIKARNKNRGVLDKFAGSRKLFLRGSALDERFGVGSFETKGRTIADWNIILVYHVPQEPLFPAFLPFSLFYPQHVPSGRRGRSSLH